MRVKLATQVFSRSVYAGLKFLHKNNLLECLGTSELIIFMDKLFDSLNSSYNSAKPLNRPITESSEHFQFWEHALAKLQELKFLDEKGNLTKNPPCIQSLIGSIKNVQLLWNVWHDLGFKCLLTRTLNQDPLENFFAIIRSLCGDNSSPTNDTKRKL